MYLIIHIAFLLLLRLQICNFDHLNECFYCSHVFVNGMCNSFLFNLNVDKTSTQVRSYLM